MKNKKEPRELRYSDSVLKYPDGTVDLHVLKGILAEAHEEGLQRSDPILVTRHKRVKNFNQEDPEWEDFQYSVSLGKLKRMYMEETDTKFVPPGEMTAEEFDQEERNSYREAMRRNRC
jgi:hypothetical protein